MVRYEPGYDTETLNELDWDPPVIRIQVIACQDGSVISVHLGKHQGEDPEKLAVALTTCLKAGQKLLKRDWIAIIREFELNPEENNFLEVQPGELKALYNMALKLGADGFLPYYDGAGYADLVAIKGKVTEMEVRRSVFSSADPQSQLEEAETLASLDSSEAGKRASFGPRHTDYITD